MTSENLRVPVTCTACGWNSRRKPGKIVTCPKSGEIAAFQMEGRA